MVSPKDLGWVGMLKALVQAGLALGAVGIVLSWPKEFGRLRRSGVCSSRLPARSLRSSG